jgi:flavin-dependent dehydrogenase
VRSRWLIDCTGRRAWAARLHGARRIGVDHLVAFVSRCERRAATDRDSLTVVESAADGWWYTSRLPAGDRVVVYLTDAHDASARRARTRHGFARLLDGTVHVRARLAAHGYAPDAPPRIVAADTSRLDRPAGDGWIAAGDAAISFDPLSSQGILTAIYTGLRSAQAVTAHLAGDCGAVTAYCDRLDAIYSAYLDHRYHYYLQERRWLAHPFWRTRRGDSPGEPAQRPDATAHL